MVYLRVLGENVLEHTGQRTLGPSVWQAWSVLFGHHRAFGRVTCLYSAGWTPSTSLLSLYIKTSLGIYLCTCVSFFKPKGTTRLQLSSPCRCRRTLGTRDQLHGRAFPGTQAFLQLPIQQGHAWHQQNMWPGCVWEPHLPEEQCLWPIWNLLVEYLTCQCPAWSSSRWVLTTFKISCPQTLLE